MFQFLFGDLKRETWCVAPRYNRPSSNSRSGETVNNVTPLVICALLLASGFVHGQEGSGGIEFIPDRLEYRPFFKGSCLGMKIKAKNGTESAIEDPAFDVVDWTTWDCTVSPCRLMPGPHMRAYYVNRSSKKKCPKPLLPGQTCQTTVRLCPPLFLSYEANLIFTGSDQKVPLIFHRDPLRW